MDPVSVYTETESNNQEVSRHTENLIFKLFKSLPV